MGRMSVIARLCNRWPFRSVRQLATDRRGAVMIEFAICSSAFFALLLACAQTLLIFFAQQALQTGAESGARYVMTGQAKGAAMTSEQFRNYVCGQMPSVFDCSKVMIDVRPAGPIDDLDTDDPTITYDTNGKPTNTQFDTGSANAILIVRVMYNWNVQLGPLNLDFSNNGSGRRLLTGVMVVMSEPYKS